MSLQSPTTVGFLQLFEVWAEASFDGMAMLEEGKLLKINPALSALFGYEPEEFVNLAGFNLIAPEERRRIRKIHAEGREGIYETVGLKNDGTRLYLEVSARNLVLQERSVRLLVVRDITARKKAEEQLRAYHDRLDALFRAVPIPLFAKDRDGCYFLTNPPFHKFFGLSPQEMLGRTVFQCWPAQDAQIYHQKDQELMAHGDVQKFEHRLRNGAGQWCEVVFTNACLHDGEGRVAGLVGTVTDITELKGAQRNLLMDEFRLNTLLRLGQMSDAHEEEIVRFALEEGVRLTESQIGYLAFANADESVLTMAAWSGQAIQESAIVQLPVAYQVGEIGLWGEAVRQRKPVITNDDNAVVDSSGESFPVGPVSLTRHMNVPVLDGKRIVAVAGVGNKVGEYNDTDVRQLTLLMDGMWRLLQRRRAEYQVKESEERFRRIFQSSPVAMGMSTLMDGRLLDVNESYIRMLGYSREEIIGRTVQDMQIWVFPEERQRMVQAIEQYGSVQGMEFRFRTKAGKTITVLGSLEPMQWGSEPCLLFINVDITERKRLEEQLRQTTKMESIGTLAGGVAHDFNNVLTVIIGQCELLLMQSGLAPMDRESVTQINDAADRASRLTRQLLAFGRKQPVKRQSLNLNETLGGMTKMLRRFIGEDIFLEYRYGKNLPPIMADMTMVDQVLMNLAVNARDAMFEGGRITITTEALLLDDSHVKQYPEARSGLFVRLSVQDTGSGILPEVLPHIFEPFFTTKEVGKGTGLGLATVHGIVHQHEGWLEVESQPGQGTTFHVYWPIAAEACPEQALAVRPEVRGGTETILLVEDEHIVRRLAKMILTMHGYKVIEAESGAEAVQMWSKYRQETDLLFTDMVMPGGIGGSQLAKMLIASKPDLKVIYTSGYASPKCSEDETIRADARRYLPKPYPPFRLAKMVRERLDEKE